MHIYIYIIYVYKYIYTQICARMMVVLCCLLLLDFLHAPSDFVWLDMITGSKRDIRPFPRLVFLKAGSSALFGVCSYVYKLYTYIYIYVYMCIHLTDTFSCVFMFLHFRMFLCSFIIHIYVYVHTYVS